MNKTLKRLALIAVLVVAGAYLLYLVQAPLSKAAWSPSVCSAGQVHVALRIGPDCREPEPEAFDVHMGYAPHKRIVWTLVPTGGARWTFAPGEGIALKPQSSDPEQRVFYARQRESDRVVRWCNANSDRGVHHYKINLVGPDGASCVIDPPIYNHD